MLNIPTNLRLALITANDTRVLVPVLDIRAAIGEAIFDAAVNSVAAQILTEDITELTP